MNYIFELISKLPPSCGVVSSTTSCIPEPANELTDANANCPLPSVFNTWSALPSTVGHLILSILTQPVPLGLKLISPFVFVDEIVFKFTLILSICNIK